MTKIILKLVKEYSMYILIFYWQNKASGFFTRQRLVHFDDEAAKWEKQVDNLPSNIKMNMRAKAVENLEIETKLLEKRVSVP